MARTLPKKPKAPKEKASLATWERYQARVKEWQQKCKMIHSDKKKKADIIARVKKELHAPVTAVSGVHHHKRKASPAKKKAAKKTTRHRRR